MNLPELIQKISSARLRAAVTVGLCAVLILTGMALLAVRSRRSRNHLMVSRQAQVVSQVLAQSLLQLHDNRQTILPSTSPLARSEHLQAQHELTNLVQQRATTLDTSLNALASGGRLAAEDITHDLAGLELSAVSAPTARRLLIDAINVWSP
ncbi:MAG: hypothetical protein AAF708_03820, partial [Deinococcota bacterium]